MTKLAQVSLVFDGKPVIDQLSYSFPDKGIFAIMGPSGCGKTSLLRLLAGLEQPSTGNVMRSHHRVAVAFQEPRLLPWLNCEENLKLVLSEVENMPKTVSYWLEALELTEVAKQLPNTLSGGMQQRLSLARALAFGGDLLLLDEPFSALDRPLKERIAPRIKAVAQQALVILVTHDREEAELLSATVLNCIGTPLHALEKDE